MDTDVIERTERITIENATMEELRAATKDTEVGPFRHFAPCKHCNTEFERNPRGRGRYAVFCDDKCKNSYHNARKKGAQNEADKRAE